MATAPKELSGRAKHGGHPRDGHWIEPDHMIPPEWLRRRCGTSGSYRAATAILSTGGVESKPIKPSTTSAIARSL